MVDKTAEDLVLARRIERHEQRLDSFEAQIEKLTAQVQALTVSFAPFVVIQDVVADLRKIVEKMRERNLI